MNIQEAKERIKLLQCDAVSFDQWKIIVTDLPEALRLIEEAKGIIAEYVKSTVSESGDWEADELSMSAEEWLKEVE